MALHDQTETPAATWPTQTVRTCGTVMSMVKIDMPPNRRRSVVSKWGISRAEIEGSGAMFASNEDELLWDL